MASSTYMHCIDDSLKHGYEPRQFMFDLFRCKSIDGDMFKAVDKETGFEGYSDISSGPNDDNNRKEEAVHDLKMWLMNRSRKAWQDSQGAEN